MRLALLQFNPCVGSIEANTREIFALAQQAYAQTGATLMVASELCITGYPPEDLLFRDELFERVEKSLAWLAEQTTEFALIVGAPLKREGHPMNAAVWVEAGKQKAVYFKRHLPNYGVFDEKRYFKSDKNPVVVKHQGIRFGLAICEDVWRSKALKEAKKAGAQIILSLNASPFQFDKQEQRYQVVQERLIENDLPIVYVNQVGGQDELVFDGGSFIMTHQGQVALQAPFFDLGFFACDVALDAQGRAQWTSVNSASLQAPQSLEARIYQALVSGLRDYVHKNGFKGAVIGLSGGVDSALTLALAVDALGADQVEAVMMPSQFTADISQTDAADQAQRMGVRYHSLPISEMVQAFETALEPVFENLPASPYDVTHQNLQARSRGVMLMAISNRKGYLVLTTGNKSEMAVGYATLYGDMAGGFAPLKDVYKTQVYRLCEYRNTLSHVIPERVITRPPSAELAPDQKDEDSLPPYPVLDGILQAFIEMRHSVEQIVRQGYERETVEQVVKWVIRNEYKRRQAAPGVKITERAFGRDRRYPMTNGFFG
jgi:NAD+ synthase (glutamine-hydrolysing)